MCARGFALRLLARTHQKTMYAPPPDLKIHATRFTCSFEPVNLAAISSRRLVPMAKNPILKSELSHWLVNQKRFASLREMSSAVGIPYNTLRGYFSGKSPSSENARRLSECTGLSLSAATRAIRPRRSPESRTDQKRTRQGDPGDVLTAALWFERTHKCCKRR